jgi:hypothetical protein
MLIKGIMSDRTTRRVVRVIGGAALLLAGAWAFLYWNPGPLIAWENYRFERRVQGLAGLSESAVVAKMGAPRETVTAAEVASEPNKVWWNSEGTDWDPAPTFPVTHRVLMYYNLFTKAFIYVGTNGLVEHVHFSQT